MEEQNIGEEIDFQREDENDESFVNLDTKKRKNHN